MSSIQLLTKERMESALLKMDFCSKPKGTYSSVLHSHTVRKYALVEDIDNWTGSYSLVIIYQICQQQNTNGWVLKELVFASKLKVGKPMLCCLSSNLTQTPSLEAFIIICVC